MMKRPTRDDLKAWGPMAAGVGALLSGLASLIGPVPLLTVFLIGLGTGTFLVALYYKWRPGSHETPQDAAEESPNAAKCESMSTGETFTAVSVIPGGATREFKIEHLTPPDGSSTVILTWNRFLGGCEQLTKWVHDYAPPRALYLGINYAGTIIASYIAGSLGDHGAKVVTYPTPPWRSDEHDFMDPREVLPASVQDGAILVTDSQIRSAYSASTLVKRLGELGFDRERIWFVCLAVGGITQANVLTARALSQSPGGLVRVPDLFRIQTNRFVKERRTEPDFYPHCLVYAAEAFVRAPDQIR